jgi:hypothetical protein
LNICEELTLVQYAKFGLAVQVILFEEVVKITWPSPETVAARLRFKLNKNTKTIKIPLILFII